VDDVGLDVVEQTLVVGDQQDAEVRVQHRIDALGDDPQGIDVEPRIGLVEDRHLGLDDRHLEHLQPLLLATGETLVDVAGREALVHPEERHLLAHLGAEIAHRNAAADRIGRVDIGILVDALQLGVQRAADERGDRQSGDRGRVLEGEEQPETRPLVRRELEDVSALPLDLTAGHDVGRVAHEGVGERRLARPVGAHDRVDLALADRQVDPLEDLLVGMAERRDVQATDDEVLVGGGRLVGHEVITAPCGSSTPLARGGARSARVMDSSVEVIASRTRTQRMFTVQRAERSHTNACSGSSDAQNIGAMGPSSARNTSLIAIASGGRLSS
jgi:hypothetical protein